MLNEQTLGTLNALKLFGMAKSFNDKLAHPQAADLSHQEFFGLIVQDEKTYRENLRLKRLLSNAKLKQQAALEDIDYKHPRGLNKQAIWQLSSQDWIAHHRNVLLTRPTGVGKSYIACALGNFAARQGHTVLYLRAPRLFETLLQSKADGSHLKTLTRLAKVQLLILDDLFLTPSTMPSAKTYSKSSRTVIKRLPPSSQASAPPRTGTTSSASLPSPMPFVTAYCTTLTKLN